MATTLNVTPEELETQGKTMEGYGDQLIELFDSVTTLVGEIDSEWDGLGQNGYTEMYDSLKDSLKQAGECVQSLGKATQEAAKAYAETDQQIANSFSGIGG